MAAGKLGLAINAKAASEAGGDVCGSSVTSEFGTFPRRVHSPQARGYRPEQQPPLPALVPAGSSAISATQESSRVAAPGQGAGRGGA